jgi:hypothetical protein
MWERLGSCKGGVPATPRHKLLPRIIDPSTVDAPHGYFLHHPWLAPGVARQENPAPRRRPFRTGRVETAPGWLPQHERNHMQPVPARSCEVSRWSRQLAICYADQRVTKFPARPPRCEHACRGVLSLCRAAYPSQKKPLRHGLHCPFIDVMLVYDKQVTASASNERQPR